MLRSAVVLALLASSTLARADRALTIQCGPVTPPAASDPIVSINVTARGAEWRVTHMSQSGMIYERNVQYLVQDMTTTDAIQQIHFAWQGRKISSPTITMAGRVERNSMTGEIVYSESVFDATKPGTKAAEFVAHCRETNESQLMMTPSGIPLRSPGGPGHAQQGLMAAIPLQSQGGTFSVPASINNALTLKFIVDSGASDVAIPADVVLTLMRTGTLNHSDFIGSQTYTLANGESVPSQTFRIRSLVVGNKTVTDVKANVSPVAGSLLLGQSFLGRFNTWSINNLNQTLVLGALREDLPPNPVADGPAE